MNLATNTDVAHEDGKRMKITNCERTAASDDWQDNHLMYRPSHGWERTDTAHPIHP